MNKAPKSQTSKAFPCTNLFVSGFGGSVGLAQAAPAPAAASRTAAERRRPMGSELKRIVTLLLACTASHLEWPAGLIGERELVANSSKRLPRLCHHFKDFWQLGP